MIKIKETKMSELEEKFKENLEAWEEHCIQKVNSSNQKDSLNCDAYRNIVAMGKPALPLIREVYHEEGDDSTKIFLVYLHNAVRKIVGSDFKIPEDIRYNLNEIIKYTPKWLDENMHKYVGER